MNYIHEVMAFILETFISQSSKTFQKLRLNGMFILLALLLVSSSSPSSLLSLIALLLYPFLLGATQHILMNGGKYTDPLIHVFHAFFGIGLFLGAQIAGPFLQVKYINRTSELQQIARNTSTPLGMLSMHFHNDSIGEDVSANITSVKVYDAPIEIPALIGGVVALGCPNIFLHFPNSPVDVKRQWRIWANGGESYCTKKDVNSRCDGSNNMHRQRALFWTNNAGITVHHVL